MSKVIVLVRHIQKNNSLDYFSCSTFIVWRSILSHHVFLVKDLTWILGNGTNINFGIIKGWMIPFLINEVLPNMMEFINVQATVSPFITVNKKCNSSSLNNIF